MAGAYGRLAALRATVAAHPGARETARPAQVRARGSERKIPRSPVKWRASTATRRSRTAEEGGSVWWASVICPAHARVGKGDCDYWFSILPNGGKCAPCPASLRREKMDYPVKRRFPVPLVPASRSRGHRSLSTVRRIKSQNWREMKEALRASPPHFVSSVARTIDVST